MRRLPVVVLPAVLLVVFGLLAAGCSVGDAPGGSVDGGATAVLQADVDVDTPALRAAKKQAGIAPCPSVEARPVAGGLPEVTLPCLGGGPDVALAGLRGPLVVNLFAQWCGPCREELPYYQQLHERTGDRVDVLGVDYQDTQPGAALELAADAGVTYPLVADPSAALRVPFRIRGLPGIVLVDEDGTVVHREYTVIRSYQQLRDLVRTYLHVEV